MTFPLTEERLQLLYSKFTAPPDRTRSMRSAIEWYGALSAEQQRTEENQAALWFVSGVGGVGPGSGVPVAPAFRDSGIVERLLALPRRVADVPGGRVAEVLQDEYVAILAMVYERTDDHRRPMALLSRVFVVLVPEHTHTVFSYRMNRELGRRMLGTPPDGQMAVRVSVRRRLREVLGPETDLSEHVRRITFCWWLANQSPLELLSPAPVVDSADFAGEDDELGPLTLRPFTRQFKGWAATRGYAETYRTVVLASVGGASPEDVAATLDEVPGFDYSPRSLRSIVNKVRRLGFMETRDGVLWPTEEGEELVEYDPPDVLVEKLLVGVYGMAQFLRAAKDGPVHKSEIYEALRAEYPNWTTDMVQGALRSWLVALGLLGMDGGRVWLTDYGKIWEQRLPAEFPKPPAGHFDASTEDYDEEPSLPKAPGGGAEPSAVEVRMAMLADKAMQAFVLDDGQLASLHAAWHGNPKKRFAIFSGLSGTGKTALMRHYAHTYCRLCGVDPNVHVALVAVSPDWRDPTGLFGYFNALHADPTYQAEPATRLLVRAALQPDLPFFLLLDEMNLARVERYLAPLLSAMETGDPIALHAHDDAVNGVPPRVSWPKRLFIGGTVNMDESTHGFSDKVLDRAFTLEFWNVDLPAFFERRAKTPSERLEAVEQVLIELHDALVPIRRHFGYRAADEVLLFVEQASVDGLLSPTGALDCAVFSKVLPRLRGTDMDGFDEALRGLDSLLASHGLVNSSAKVRSMLEALERTGVAKFFA